MGGWGSGRDEYAETPTVERAATLDVNDLTDIVTREGVVGPRRKQRVPVDGTPMDQRGSAEHTVGVKPLDSRGDPHAEAVWLTYHHRFGAAGEHEETSHAVTLTYTDCHFGGERPWFECPGQGCGERVAKLHLPPMHGVRYFLCRDCYDLGYASARASGDPVEQAKLRYQRAFERLDAENRRPHPGHSETPNAPSGMHLSTQAAHLRELFAAKRAWNDAIASHTETMVSRAGKFIENQGWGELSGVRGDGDGGEGAVDDDTNGRRADPNDCGSA